MHPILLNKARLGIYLVGWIPASGLLAALLATSAGAAWPVAIAIALPLGIVFGFFPLGAWPLCRSLPLGRTNWQRLVATHAVAAIVSSGVWVSLGKLWSIVLSRTWHPSTGGSTNPFAAAGADYSRAVALLFTIGALSFLLSAVLHYLLLAFEASRDAERRAFELQVLARDAELRALKAQIKPHFLFNSLNSIAALAGSDPAGARRMCILLSEFLRGTMRLAARDGIPLAEEIALAENFLAIEQVRFGSRLAIEKQIAPNTEACLVPPLLLQPLVENAIGHGVAGLVEGGVVRIASRRVGDDIELSVENPRDPESVSSSGALRSASEDHGMGLRNVRARLQQLVPIPGRLDVQQSPDRYRVVLTFPALSQSAETIG